MYELDTVRFFSKTVAEKEFARREKSNPIL